MFASNGSFLLALSLSLGAVDAQQPAPPGGTITGFVRDSRGEPVVAAEVWCERTQRLAQGRTDGLGFFVLTRIPPASDAWVRVAATAPGMSREVDHATITPGHLEDHVGILLWDAASIRGRVVDERGEPVRGATVIAANDEARVFGFDPLGEAVTDEAGRFEMAKVPLGETQVRAWAPGFVVGQTALWHAGDREGVTVTLAKGSGVTLDIRVEGLPEGVAATVQVLPYGRGSHQVLPAPVRGSTEDGTFVVAGLPDLEFNVSVYAPGHSFQPRQLTVKPGKTRHEFRFTAVADATNVVRGVLRNSDGDALAGERLVCRAANGGRQSEATTTADGAFSFESPLAPGTEAVIYLVDSAYVTARPKPADDWSFDARDLVWHEFVVDPQQPLAIVAQPVATVEGVVRDSEGHAVAFERITLQEFSPNRMPRWMAFQYGTTDRDGRFRFGRIRPPAGPIRVAFGANTTSPASDDFVLDVGEHKTDLELIVARPGTTRVAGRVIDERGEPVAGARVWLRDWDFAKGGQASGSVIEVLTGRDGRYRFTAVDPGGHYLQVYLENDREALRSEPFELEAGSECQRDFEVTAPAGR